MRKLNLEELKEKINKVGSKLNPRVMVNEFSRRNGRLLVSVKNLETGEISKPLGYFSLLKGSSPWSRTSKVDKRKEKLQDKINKVGSKLKPRIGFNQFEGRNKWAGLLVSVRNLETNEVSKPLFYSSILKGSNPWSRKLNLEESKDKINNIGSKLNPRIGFNQFEGRNKHGHLLVSVRNLDTNEISKPSYYYDILKGSNPFVNKLNLEELKEKINKIGSKLNPKIGFNRFEGRNKHGKLLVSVRNLETNEISKPLSYHDISNGSSPWNKDQNRVELREVHPRIEKIVKKYGFKIEKNYRLGKREFIDFRISHQKLNYKIAIEAKQSDKFFTYSKEQQKRYRQKASLKQHNIKKLFFVDPKGAHKKHGFISYSELETSLKQII